MSNNNQSSNNKLNSQNKNITEYIMEATVLNQNENERLAQILKIKSDYKESNPRWRGGITKDFKKFNLDMIKNGSTDTLAFSENKFYNHTTGRLMNRDTLYTKTGKLRTRFNNDNIVVKNNTFRNIEDYTKPLATRINLAELKDDDVRIPIDFNKVDKNLSKLLKILRPTTKKYMLHDLDTDKFYTLSSATINSIQEKLLNPVVGMTGDGSDADIVEAFYEDNEWELVIINDESGDKFQLIDGGFFDHTIKETYKQSGRFDLQAYGVYYDIDKNNYTSNCLIDALKQSGLDTTHAKTLCMNQEIPLRHLKSISENLGICISVKRVKKLTNCTKASETTWYNKSKKSEKWVKLGLINKHYFLIEKVKFTSYYMKNYLDIHHLENANTIYQKRPAGGFKRSSDSFIDSYQAIQFLWDNRDKYLDSITHTDELYHTSNYKKIDSFGSLDYNDWMNDFDGNGGNLTDNRTIDGTAPECILGQYYFDFETTTGRNDKKTVSHTPYCLFTDKNPLGWFGDNCGKAFLNDLIKKHGVPVVKKTDKEKSCKEVETPYSRYTEMRDGTTFVRLIAHNAGYDFRFLMKYMFSIETIEKGTGLMDAKCLYYSNNKCVCINIRDSLKMINMPLRKFSKAFDLSVKKEILPYDLYTEENVKKNWIKIEKCLKYVKKEDQVEYMANCKRWDCICEGRINILKYSGEYCYMDCITLRDGYECFRSLVSKAIQLDINNYMTLPSMANDYLVGMGCYDGVLKISGVPRHFIQNCVVGGRVMCKQNKKQKVTDQPLADFDAVSLYPSAMARMRGFLMGKPNVISDFDAIKNTADGYYIRVKITKVGKKYDFPCASVKTDDGIRCFTNDLVGQIIYTDNIALDDLVRFQDVEYEFIDGYYYNEGFQTRIKEVIESIFQQRLKYKAEGNPLQLVFKELMNSSYGKTCLKPIDCDCEYIPVKRWKKYCLRHYNYIKEATLLANGLFYKVKLIKSIEQHFNNVHIGVSILSTSKTIMYEVMITAEDLGIDMYYTDTDSIHIDNSKIKILSDKFREKYGRELIGKNMGQFHTDFELDDSVGEIVAIESIILGKKCYLDKLYGKDKDGKELTDYHIRMKGVSSNCIRYKADKEYGGDCVKMFNELYDGKTLEFDLLAVGVSFEMCANMSIKSRKQFKRRIKFVD